MSLNQIGKAIWNPHGQIPTDSWIHAIVEKTPFGDTVLLPGVAQGYATDIVWHGKYREEHFSCCFFWDRSFF